MASPLELSDSSLEPISGSSLISSTDKEGAESVRQFRALLDRMVAYGRDEKMDLVGYDSPVLPRFRQLPAALQTQTIGSLKEYIDLLEDVRNEGEALKNNLRGVWSILSRLRLRPDSRLFEILQSSDIVEVYSLSGIQLFRSFHFFEICSYTLEELFTTPWYELFGRDPAINEIYGKMFETVVTGTLKTTTRWELPVHEVREIFGRRSYVNEAEHICVSPLFDREGQLAGAVHAFRSRLIDKSV